MPDSQPSSSNANTSTILEKTVVPTTPQPNEITSKPSINIDSTNIDSTTEQEKKSSNDVDAKASRDPEKLALEPTQPSQEPPHTILTEKEKIFTIIMASFAAFISPVSSSIYYPALNSLAHDLNVTVSTMNLTITVYMVCST